MNATLTHYMNGNPDDFQDFLENSDCTNDDKADALAEISKHGWDECLEILVNRDDPLLLTQYAAQAFASMAGNGHTAAWLLMLPSFYEGHKKAPALWSEALQVGKDDAKMDGHWDVYALTKALEGLIALKTPAAQAQMTLIGMRIELMHGMDPATASQETADAFAYQRIAQASDTKNVVNVFDDMNFV